MTNLRTWALVAAAAVTAACFTCGDARTQDGPPDGGVAELADDAADDGDSEWPRTIDAESATIVVYQPQLDAFADGVVEAHSALAITAAGAEEPVFGAAWFRAKVETDRDERVCRFVDVEVPRARFPEATPEAEADLVAILRAAVPGWVHPISMDRLLPALEALDAAIANDDRLRHDPPAILVETVPALLVPIDGEAKLGAVPGSRVQRVVNSPVAILFEPASRTWWIDAGAAWLYATRVDGPYRAAETPPKEVAAVATSNEEDPQDRSGGTRAAGAPPKVVVVHEPAELLVFDGAPRWTPLVGEELSFAANTSSAVFRTNSDGSVWALLSGRWFRAGSLASSKWEFVPADALPACFQEIPEDSDVGGVLAHVAGTDLANEALLDAQVPQTKAIRRDTAKCVVSYDGPPRFVAVPGTDLLWAANTESQVILCNGLYYCCDQGVWFVAETPDGPWFVADQVPRAFQQIPPECPVYNVKYVVVLDATPEVVYVGYTPGYLGWYCCRGVVVWGTGWRYPCWFGERWYPRCATWGVSVAYNAWSGGWYAGLSFASYRGWSLGIGLFHGSRWGGSWWGPAGYRPWRRHDGECHRPATWSRRFDRPGPGAVRRHRFTLYDHPRNRVRNAPERSATRPVSRPAAQPRAPSRPPAARPPAPRPRNDVFSDREGRIWRRAGDGSWQQRSGREWRPVPRESLAPPRPVARPRTQAQRPPVRPAPSVRLGRDARARDRGAVRTRGGGGGGQRDGGRRR